MNAPDNTANGTVRVYCDPCLPDRATHADTTHDGMTIDPPEGWRIVHSSMVCPRHHAECSCVYLHFRKRPCPICEALGIGDDESSPPVDE